MEQPELGALIKRRTYIKGRVTKFRNFLSGIERNESASGELAYETVNVLHERLEKLKIASQEFDEIQAQIDLLHENVNEQIEELEKMEDEFCQLIGKAKVFLNPRSSGSEAGGCDGSVHSAHNSVYTEHQGMGRGSIDEVKLPRIDLPKFSGDLNNWLEFRDTFRSLIHENFKLGNTQKFHYLRAVLDGTAKQVIHSLEFSGENYAIAWDSLCDRFNNTRLLIDSHLKKLFAPINLAYESAVKLRKLCDLITKHVRALELLGQPTSYWDTLIIFNMTSKLDKKSLREWEEFKCRLTREQVPTLHEFKQFLRNRADLLETIQPTQRETKPQFKTKSFVVADDDKRSCVVCKGVHAIVNCPTFLKLSTYDRANKVKELKLCLNCLKPNHHSRNCVSGTCRQCKAKHHTLIHFERSIRTSNNPADVSNEIVQGPAEGAEHPRHTTSMSMSIFGKSGVVLLSTVRILVNDSKGKPVQLRALLDSASQSCFISRKCCEKLGIAKSKANLLVTGIGQSTTDITERCQLEFQSYVNSFRTTVTCFILPYICEALPAHQLDISELVIPPNIRLADPEFHKSAEIDVLLGAELFYQLLCVGQYRFGGLVLQKTKLGWVFSGLTNQMSAASCSSVCQLSVNSQLQQQLAKFWEVEEVGGVKHRSDEELSAEKIFTETVRRTPEGRFIVTIPLKHSVETLGVRH